MNEFYYSERPWSIIKSFVLTFDKSRSTKTAKIMKPLCELYKSLIKNEDILPDSGFPFIYFYTTMPYRRHFNYAIFQRL